MRDSMRQGWLIAEFVGLVAFATSCAANNGLGAHDAGTNDGPSVCRGQDIPSTCPATWRDALTKVECNLAPASVRLGRMGSYLARELYYVDGPLTDCLYDGSSQALVGAHRSSPLADFCNETSTSIDYGAATPDKPFENDPSLGTAPTCPGRGMCHGDLALSGCASTWAEAETRPECGLPPGILFLGHAGGFLARAIAGGYTAFDCYYDPVTKALVGAFGASDVSTYCDGTSYDILYGTATEGLEFHADIGPGPTCPTDGGADQGQPNW